MFVDGFKLYLNIDFIVIVDFMENVCNIVLLRGEVYFDVVYDMLCFFMVIVGNNIVIVVGIVFNM